VKGRIAEIQNEVHSRASMAIDEKRDHLRQMIEGTIPTKLTRRWDGTVEAVFDMLGALVADAKMAGEFDGAEADEEPEFKLSFEVYHRNHPNPPREWLEREIVPPEAIEEGLARSSSGAGQCGFLLGCNKHNQQKHTHDQPF